MFDKNYSVMVINLLPEEIVSDEACKEAYDILFDEFLQRGGGVNYLHSNAVIKEISRLSSKILVVEFTIEMMKISYSDILISIINDYGFKREFKNNKEFYNADIAFVEAKLGADKLRLTLKKQELEEVVKLGKEGKTMDLDSYNDMIWDISIAFKLQFDLEKLSVNDLLVLKKKFKKHIDNTNRNTRR